MTDLLIELLTEEIPARFQESAENNFFKNIVNGLKENSLEFSEALSYSTPRRLALIIKGLPEKQPDIKKEIKGPKEKSPQQALDGFFKSVELSIKDCELRDTDKGKVYYAVINKIGQPTQDILPEIINSSISGISWSNSMRFGNSNFRFIRPLRRIVAVFGDKKINSSFKYDMTEIEYTDKTTGHRFLSNNDIVVNANNYEQELQKIDIIPNRKVRLECILNQLNKLSNEKGITLIQDNSLLNEVVGLVEMPVVLIGNIAQRFMKLPKEVLITSMREHQKFFVFEDNTGNLAPYFATIANIKASDGGQAIISGNERVLSARLADSEFFYHNDLKINLEELLPKLRKMTFHAKLGSVYDRTERMKSLAQDIARDIGASENDTKLATELCKCDLVSKMVFEFPELQGIMGSYYAIEQGKSKVVANAIKQHYQPQGLNDNIPTDGVSISVAIAEKLDTLVGFWLINEKPTGSKDSYALRRCALGIIRIILENDLRIDLSELILNHQKSFAELNINCNDITNDLLAFFSDRIKSHLKSQGIRHDFISAVIATGIKNNLPAKVKLAEELSNNSAVVSQVKANYTRAKNITDKFKILKFFDVDEELLNDDSEKNLYTLLNSSSIELKKSLENEDFKKSVSILASLAPALNNFFENVMVNDDNELIRSNRLNILGKIIETASSVANFDIIEG